MAVKRQKSKPTAGRPRDWGDLVSERRRYPITITAQIDKIRDQFIEPEDAEQYILECLTQKRKMQRLKLYDCKISATPGITGFGEDSSYEEVEVPVSLLKHPDQSFAVRVSGDSMEDAGICNGNVIIVRKIHPLFEKPLDKAIVTAVVEDQLVVKRYRCRYNKKYELLSENQSKNYPAIPISPEMSEHQTVYIFGVFQQVVPNWMIGE